MKKFLAISLSIVAIFLGYRYGWRWYIGNDFPDSEIAVIYVLEYEGSRVRNSNSIGQVYSRDVPSVERAITRSRQMDEGFSLGEADYKLQVFYDNHDILYFNIWLSTSDSNAYLSWDRESDTYYQIGERTGDRMESMFQSLEPPVE